MRGRISHHVHHQSHAQVKNRFSTMHGESWASEFACDKTERKARRGPVEVGLAVDGAKRQKLAHADGGVARLVTKAAVKSRYQHRADAAAYWVALTAPQPLVPVGVSPCNRSSSGSTSRRDHP